MWSQKNQGETQHGLTFGYVGEEGDGGGYFFTWRSTLDATLASVEEDTVDRPKRLKLRAVEAEIRRLWRQEESKEWNSLIPAEAAR